MDDTYLLGSPSAVERGLAVFQAVMAAISLKVHPTKTKVWGAAKESLPESIRCFHAEELVAMGTSVVYARATARRKWVNGDGKEYAEDADPSRNRAAMEVDTGGGAGPSTDDDRTDVRLTTTLDGSHPQEFIDRHDEYFDRLRTLSRAGLSKIHCLTLLRTWSQGAGVHIIRAVPLTRMWAAAVDDSVYKLLEFLMGVSLSEVQRHQATLQTGSGGLGLGSMVARREAAWLGAWEGGIAAAADALGITSMMEFEERWPAFKTCVDSMEKSYNASTSVDSKLSTH